MVIGFDASRAFVEGRTGTENYSFQLLKHLSLIDTKNKYLIYLGNARGPVATHPQSMSSLRCGHSLGDPQLHHPSHIHNSECQWPANFKFIIINLPRLWTQLGLAARTFIDPLDVLFVPSHTLPLIRKPGLKTVITVHDLGAEYLPGFHQLKQVLYLKLMTHYQLKTASRIIAVSEATKKDLVKKIGIKIEKMNLPRYKNRGSLLSRQSFGSKIKVVYEGVDKTIFKPIPKDVVRDIVKKYDLEREKYFLFVGTIQPRKNLECLIRAFKIFARGPAGSVSHRASSLTSFAAATRRDPSSQSPLASYNLQPKTYNLVLVGQKGWKSEGIYDLPEKLGIKDKVRFLGRISDQDLVGLYNGATALTYPSLFEGFGLPIIEAFSCGCPVITSNVSSMPEVAGNAAVLVNPEKEEDIAAAMVKIANDDMLRDSLIKKGYNRSEGFNWEKTAKETVEIFMEAKRS